MSETCKALNKAKAVAYIQPGCALSCCVKDFESREQQQHMLQDIVDAYNNNEITLIEAGTGTGKSIAYLIPAILWAIQNKERTLISTHTINLQEQLINKDIPLAKKALGVEFKAVLVKGMSNYVCLRKIEETKWDKNALTPIESEEFSLLEPWSETSKDGSLSDLSFIPSRNLWEKICAESDTCNQKKCPYFKNCHFFKARREAEEAQILVANHSMLCADLIVRNDPSSKNPGVIPDYNRIILDEAHNLEDVATEFFAKRVSHLQLIRLISRLGSETQGKLSLLNKKLLQMSKQNQSSSLSSIYDKLTIDLPGTRRDLLYQINETFQSYADFIQNTFLHVQEREDSNATENKHRILPMHWEKSDWQQNIVEQSQKLIELCNKYIVMIHLMNKDLDHLNTQQAESLNGLRHEINALAARLAEMQENLKHFTSSSMV